MTVTLVMRHVRPASGVKISCTDAPVADSVGRAAARLASTSTLIAVQQELCTQRRKVPVPSFHKDVALITRSAMRQLCEYCQRTLALPQFRILCHAYRTTRRRLSDVHGCAM